MPPRMPLVAALTCMVIVSLARGGVSDPSGDALSLREQQRVIVASQRIAMGYLGLTTFLKNEKFANEADITRNRLLALGSAALIERYGFDADRIERNPDRSMSLKGTAWYKLLGMGGEFRMAGILTIEGDGRWEYVHERSLDAKGEPFAAMLRGGSSIVISSDGFTIRPPQIRGAEEKGPATRPGTDDEVWLLGGERAAVTLQRVESEGVSRSRWETFTNFAQERRAVPLHLPNAGPRYLSVRPGKSYVFRVRDERSGDVDFVWLRRDDEGFWARAETSTEWSQLWLGERQRFSGDSGEVSWSVEFVRPTQSSLKDGSEVTYKLVVKAD
jgi:hypothetical protein